MLQCAVCDTLQLESHVAVCGVRPFASPCIPSSSLCCWQLSYLRPGSLEPPHCRACYSCSTVCDELTGAFSSLRASWRSDSNSCSDKLLSTTWVMQHIQMSHAMRTLASVFHARLGQMTYGVVKWYVESPDTCSLPHIYLSHGTNTDGSHIGKVFAFKLGWLAYRVGIV